MAERRNEGVGLLQAGTMSQAQIARHLGVSEATVSKWKKKLDQGGPEALPAFASVLIFCWAAFAMLGSVLPNFGKHQ